MDRVEGGKRRLKSFAKKKDATAFEATASVEVRAGVHTADSASITIAEAGRSWIETGEQNGLERTTLNTYRQHLKLHIEPYLGAVKLSQLSAPMVREFEDRLGRGDMAGGREPRPRSSTMVRRVRVSLSSLLSDAQERGLVSLNVVRDLRKARRRGAERQAEKRQKGKLKVGVDIPTREEIKAIVGAAKGRWRPLLLTAIFTGLRASELRGLRWRDVDFDKRELHVRQRADCYSAIGSPKSEAGERTVPLTPTVFNTLREWKLACPKGKLDLVFPTGKGNVEIALEHRQARARPDTCRRGRDRVGSRRGPGEIHRPSRAPALLCVVVHQRSDRGGLELPAKVVQERLGHSSIMMTMDVYGHLFPRGDDSAKLAEAESKLLA